MDRQEVEYIVDLAIAKHKVACHRKPKARQEKNRYNEQFETFWKAFKGRWNPDRGYVKVGKYDAWLEWQKLPETDQKRAMAVAKYVRGQYVKDAHRWLKEKMFDDYKVR